jgi:hypothetical protein
VFERGYMDCATSKYYYYQIPSKANELLSALDATRGDFQSRVKAARNDSISFGLMRLCNLARA